MLDTDKYCNYCNRRCCIDVIIFILSILLTFVIGVIVGALTGLFALLRRNSSLCYCSNSFSSTNSIKNCNINML